MAFPDGNISTADVDSETDRAYLIRGVMLALVGQFNALVSWFGNFGKDLAATANAAEARTALDVYSKAETSAAATSNVVTSTTYATNTTHNITVSSTKKLLLMVSYNGGNGGLTSVTGNFNYGIASLAASRTFASGTVDYQTPFGFSMQAIVQATGGTNLQVRMNTAQLDGYCGAPANFFLTVIEL